MVRSFLQPVPLAGKGGMRMLGEVRKPVQGILVAAVGREPESGRGTAVPGSHVCFCNILD